MALALPADIAIALLGWIWFDPLDLHVGLERERRLGRIEPFRERRRWRWGPICEIECAAVSAAVIDNPKRNDGARDADRTGARRSRSAMLSSTVIMGELTE